MSRPRRAASGVNKTSVSVARSSPSPDEAKRSIHLTVKMPSSKLREATESSRKKVSIGDREGLEGGEILSGPRGSRAKRSVVVESDSEEGDDEENDEDAAAEEDEDHDAEGDDDDPEEDDDDPEEEDEVYDDSEGNVEADETNADADADADADPDVDADGDIEMDNVDVQPPPPILKITGPSSKPSVSVPPAPPAKLKSVESKETEMADEDDEELSDLGSDGEDVDNDQDDEGRSVGGGSRSSTPDFSKMTKRQRSRMDQVMGGDFLQLPMEPQIKKHLTAEEHAMRRAEMARRRKNLSEKRNEEEKLDTINRLLKKQAPKRRGKISAAEITADAMAPQETPEVEYEKANPVYVRWVSDSNGSRLLYGWRVFMAGWKTRGYVPDSDEEEESLSNKSDSQKRHDVGISSGEIPDDLDDITDGRSIPDDQPPENSLRDVSHRVGENHHETTAWGTGVGRFAGIRLDPPSGSQSTDELQEDHFPTFSKQSSSSIHENKPAVHQDSSNNASPIRSSLSSLSPLSSPPSSSPTNDLLPKESHDTLRILDQAPSGIWNEADIASELVDQNPGQTSDSGHGQGPRRTRSLRQRNPIQLHPYAIEGEKYRQILKARGVKPLRIAPGESQLAGGPLEDSQADEFQENLESQENLHPIEIPLSSSLTGSSTVSPQFSQPTFPSFNFDEDELPDVEAILRSMPRGTVSNGHKRRKIKHTFAKKNRKGISSSGRQYSVQISDSGMNDGEDSIFDILPSPPRPRTPISSPRSRSPGRGFRFPKGLSPIPSPTPVTSSEPRTTRPTSVCEAPQTDARSSVGASSGDDDDLKSIENEKPKDRRLEGVQRRIRGVLPASWLRLDLKAQAQAQASKKLPRRDEALSPEEISTPRKGIARPVVSRGVRPRLTDSPEDIIGPSSDSESSQMPPAALKRQSFTRAARSPDLMILDDEELPMPSDLWGEVAEDNRIDTMIPSVSRKKGNNRFAQAAKPKKRQIRLTALRMQHGQNNERRAMKSSESRPKNFPRPSERRDKPRKLKFRPPDLSLLDVPSLGTHPNGSVPAFLRVAQRTVRSRKDGGKSNPRRKYVRLANDSDTLDANEHLYSWREGTLKPDVTSSKLNSSTLATSRSPLQPCTDNRGSPFGIDSSDGQALKARRSKDVQPKSRSTKPRRTRVAQSSLDHLIQCETPDPQQSKLRQPRQVRRHGGTVLLPEPPIRTGHLSTSLRDPDHVRPAHLESLQMHADRDHPRSAFRRRLHGNGRSSLHDQDSNPLLAKFLSNESEPTGVPTVTNSDNHERMVPVNQTRVSHRRPRKSRARRLDVQASRTSDSNEDLEIDDDLGPLARSDHSATGRAAATFTGLGPYGTVYNTTLNAAPLPLGSYFSAETFIGSGDFARSFIKSDLDKAQGYFILQHEQSDFRWGPWNENVSTQLGIIFDHICGSFQEGPKQRSVGAATVLDRAVKLLRDTIRYFSTNLSFYDPIDRRSFLERCKGLVSSLLHSLTSSPYQSNNVLPETAKRLYIQAGSLCAVLAGQLWQISKHHTVTQVVQCNIGAFLKDAVSQTLSIAVGVPHSGLTHCLTSLETASRDSVTLGNRHAAIQSLVLASHLLMEDDSLNTFWRTLDTFLSPPSAKPLNDVEVLDRCWQRLFLVLPFLEMDQHGVLEPGRRHKISTDNWTVIHRLLEPVFVAYQSSVQRQGSTMNDYCRAVFGRCLELINVWGWIRCESNIGILFDFFARRSLFHLPNEESNGSPSFLAHLGHRPVLTWTPEDRCFHLLLKVMGSGLRRMQKVYPSKKIRSIVWRLMPNHGRFLPKDQAIHQRDLDALRNHHDLLCTLYWASPHGFRPKPTIVQNLVDLENSHKEACRISIRAWSILTTFQLAANEGPASIGPFTTWFRDLLGQILHQHQHARLEPEEQVRQAETTEGFAVNRSLLESTIAQNQRQIESLLGDALLAMKNAVNVATDLEASQVLLFPEMLSVLDLFNAQSPQTNKILVHALEMYSAFAIKVLPQGPTMATEDDSQDYGDWLAFDAEIPLSGPITETRQDLEQHFQQPLRKLLSNCFGADKSPEDPFLVKVIDTWVVCGRISVLQGNKTWVDYIGDYGHDSWASLRDTEQTRKFSAYYLAALVNNDISILKEHKQGVLKTWISSLVERESLLKYQNALTSSLLNGDPHDPILVNPPFWMSSGRFDITPSEFAERRLLLISNVLSNMRKSVDDALAERIADAGPLRANYKELVKVMMSSMKSNYQELGHGPDLRGAYVDFVHRVIEFLQQHTSSICPVDRFFTDSASFPLPATDPTYVVGQLKNYGLRLRDPRALKQLVVFVQSVSERAAVDGQQAYLVEQLSTAMAGQGSKAGTDLRTFLITNVFQAYIETALGTTCGWNMAVPTLQATKTVFSSIMHDVDGTDPVSVGSMSTMIMGFFRCLQRSTKAVIDRPGLLMQPRTLKILATYFAIITAALPTLDYLCRLSNKTRPAAQLLDYFKAFAIFAAESILQTPHSPVDTPAELDDWARENHGVITDENENVNSDIRAFAAQELRDT
ncbi:MAG: hypothetical protein Q9194_005656, partial [Teloschistes cf. exilis]